MNRRIVTWTLAVALLALTGALGWQALKIWRSYSTDETDANSPGSAGTSAQSAGNSELLRLRNSIREQRRVRPDGRALMAVAEAVRFADGSAVPTPVAEPAADSSWTVACPKAGAGTSVQLPGIPNFDDLFAMVRTFASRAGETFKRSDASKSWDESEIEKLIDAFWTDSLLQAADELDRIWIASGPDARTAKATARVLTDLLSQVADEFQVADVISARAMAACAWADSLAPGSVDEEKCLLAKLMGYDADSYRMAARLPSTSAVARLCRSDDEAQDDADPRTAYLRLLCLAELEKNEDFHKAAKLLLTDTSQLAATTAWYRFDDFDQRNASPDALFAAATKFAGVTRKADGLISLFSGSREMKLADAEAAWLETEGGAPKRLNSGELKSAIVRAAALSAVYGKTKYLGIEQASVQSARSFLSQLGEGKSLLSSEVSQWARSFIENQNGKLSLRNLCGDIGRQKLVAAAAYDSQLETQLEVGNTWSAVFRSQASTVQNRLDSRPSNRAILRRIARSCLLDPGLADALMLADAKETASLPLKERLAVALYVNDIESLNTLVENPALSAADCTNIVERISKRDGTSPDLVKRTYTALIARFPEDYEVTNSYGRYLADKELCEEGERINAEFLRGGGRKGQEFKLLFATNNLAMFQMRLGKIKEGLRTIEPALESNNGTTMRLYSMLLDRDGQTDEARSWAMKATNRYADNIMSRLALTAHYWYHHEYEKAAESLATFKVPVPNYSWRIDGGSLLRRSLWNQSSDEYRKAFVALANAGMSRILNPMGYFFEEEGQPEIAFLAYECEKPERPQDGILINISAYRALKAWKGEEEAKAWFAKKNGGSDPGLVAALAFSARVPDLVSLPDPDKLRPPESTNVRLMQIAEDIASHDDGRIGTARSRMKSVKGKSDQYVMLSRYLVGAASEDEIVRIARDSHTQTECSFFLGWKAEHTGDLKAAAEWYAVCAGLGSTHDLEYRMALDRLQGFCNKGMSLSAQSGQ